MLFYKLITNTSAVSSIDCVVGTQLRNLRRKGSLLRRRIILIYVVVAAAVVVFVFVVIEVLAVCNCSWLGLGIVHAIVGVNSGMGAGTVTSLHHSGRGCWHGRGNSDIGW